MRAIRRWSDGLRVPPGDRDPRAALAAKVALLVALNQPFYPLYFYWSVSHVVLPACLTFLSTPFFAAVPFVTKRSRLAGSILLLLAGLGNTLLCRIVFGPASGVDVFLLPCLVLATLLFRHPERRYALAFVAAAFAIYLLPDAMLPAPMHIYGAEEHAALRRLNFLSAAGLTAMIPVLFSGADRGLEIQASPRDVDPSGTEGSRR